MEFEAVIGLEVHAQLKTNSKIFCGCSTAFGAKPNAHTCPICLGMPGTLPVLNKRVVEFAMRMGLATGGVIQRSSVFERKNYFYPDLPKNYQISQYKEPLAVGGYVDIFEGEKARRVGLTRIHMEEDAGKLIHDPDKPVSYVDLNRGGTALIEIVSEPDLRSAEEAGEYLRKLRSIVRYLGICDGNLEEGSFRCDANVSIRPKGQYAYGTRVEVKNLNSFRNVEKAIEYEIERHKDVLFEGGELVQETRLWDADKQTTHSMRSKEEAHDYRYFPDPDLVPVVIEEDWIDEVRRSLPELPDARKKRFVEELGLSADIAQTITADRALADYFEDALTVCPNAKLTGNWITGHFLASVNALPGGIGDCPVASKALGGLLMLVDKGVISAKSAKDVFEEMGATQKSAQEIIEAQDMGQISNKNELESIVDAVIAASPEEAEAYRSGKTKLMSYFVGQIMKETKGRANPKLVNQLLQAKLGK